MDQQMPVNDEMADIQEPVNKKVKLSTSDLPENDIFDATTTSNLPSPLALRHISPDTDIPKLSSTEEQQALDTMHHLQQLEAAHSQLAQVAAGLDDNNNFQFLTNFENSIAASVMAAAAAAAAATTSASGATSPDTTTTTATHTGDATPNFQSISPNAQSQETFDQQQHHTLNQLPTELLKRELMNQKVRADNRERKKRWRQQNEERNKDNDLRCRVNKRAHKLFGKEESEHKKKWINEEFLKRQQKRKDKERRKGLVDDSLGGHHHATDGHLNAATANGALDLAALAQHLQPQPLSSMTDANYLTLLCNNLGIPAAARSIIGTHNAAAAAAASQQQHEQQEQSLSHTTSAGTSQLQDDHSLSKQDNTDMGDDDQDDKNLQPFPFQLLELLQQLQQYQPTQQNDEPSDQASSSSAAAATAAAAADTHNTTDFQQLQQQFNAMTERPEEKLAALLASTLQAAAATAASHCKQEDEDEQENTSENNTTVNQHDGEQQQLQLNNNNAEFPMDAVLTLMQLNAGWRH